jgi:hypothetical protein
MGSNSRCKMGLTSCILHNEEMKATDRTYGAKLTLIYNESPMDLPRTPTILKMS